MTLREVAERIGLSESTVRRAIRDGELRAVKIRGRILIEEDAYREWLDANTIRPAAPATPHRRQRPLFIVPRRRP